MSFASLLFLNSRVFRALFLQTLSNSVAFFSTHHPLDQCSLLLQRFRSSAGVVVETVVLHSTQPWPIGRAGGCELMIGYAFFYELVVVCALCLQVWSLSISHSYFKR